MAITSQSRPLRHPQRATTDYVVVLICMVVLSNSALGSIQFCDLQSDCGHEICTVPGCIVDETYNFVCDSAFVIYNHACISGVCMNLCCGNFFGSSVIAEAFLSSGAIFSVFSGSSCDRKPLSGLNVSQLLVLEDQEPLDPFESFTRIVKLNGTFSLATLMLLDMSGSISEDPIARGALYNASLTFVQNYPKGQLLSIQIFDGAVALYPLIELEADTIALTSAVNEILTYEPTDLSTNLYGAVTNGINYLMSADLSTVSKLAMVTFTDGRDEADYSQYSFTSAVDAVSSSTVQSFAVGLGVDIDVVFLTAITANGSNFFFSENITLLDDTFFQLAKVLNTTAQAEYQIGYCSPLRQSTIHNYSIYADISQAIFPSPSTQAVYIEVIPPRKFNAATFSGGCTNLTVIDQCDDQFSNPVYFGCSAADETSSSGLSGGAIAGIVISVLVVVSALVALIVCFRKVDNRGQADTSVANRARSWAKSFCTRVRAIRLPVYRSGSNL